MGGTRAAQRFHYWQRRRPRQDLAVETSQGVVGLERKDVLRWLHILPAPAVGILRIDVERALVEEDTAMKPIVVDRRRGAERTQGDVHVFSASTPRCPC